MGRDQLEKENLPLFAVNYFGETKSLRISFNVGENSESGGWVEGAIGRVCWVAVACQALFRAFDSDSLISSQSPMSSVNIFGLFLAL